MQRIVIALAVLTSCKAAEDYARKSKKTEASLMLNKLSKMAKTYAIAQQKYPAGSTGITPAIPCCKQQGMKCQPDPKVWTGPWAELEFQIDDPHLFRYSYESDGKTFTAKAVGDLDCDENEITYGTVTGKLVDGTPSVTIDETPSGTD